jgi:hypothetical protein
VHVIGYPAGSAKPGQRRLSIVERKSRARRIWRDRWFPWTAATPASTFGIGVRFARRWAATAQQEREEDDEQDDREVRLADHVHSPGLHPVVPDETEDEHGTSHP